MARYVRLTRLEWAGELHEGNVVCGLVPPEQGVPGEPLAAVYAAVHTLTGVLQHVHLQLTLHDQLISHPIN